MEIYTTSTFRDIHVEQAPAWWDESTFKFHYHTCAWCNAQAFYMVYRTSNSSDEVYADLACIYHAREWAPVNG